MGGCDFGNGLFCYPTGSTWTCFKNGYRCASGCSNPITCCGEFTCPKRHELPGTFENNYCNHGGDDGFYCTTDDNAYYQYCYMKKDNTRCLATSSFYPSHIEAGHCLASTSSCPSGMKFGYVKDWYWGCVGESEEKKGYGCFYNKTYASYSPNDAICYYINEGVTSACGEACAYDGTGCKKVYMDKCALAGHCIQNGQEITYTGNSPSCICDGVETNGHCCPAGHVYVNGGCAIIQCSGSTPYLNLEASECVTVCPNYVHNKVCVDSCPTGTSPDTSDVCQIG